METAARKLAAFRSYRVAMRRKSLRRQNMRSMALRFAVEERREAVLPFAVGFGGCWESRRAPQPATHGVAVIALVGVPDVAIWKLFEQQGAWCAVGDLAASQHEGERPGIERRSRVDFHRAPAARAADGLIFRPFSARRAVSFHGRRVEEHLVGRTVGFARALVRG